MRIVDPQTAILSNIEVLAYLTSNPPKRLPDAPSNVRNWVPRPDLRNHNTVVKEIHNYVERLSPHLLNYPRYIHAKTPQEQAQQQQPEGSLVHPLPSPTEPTPVDLAIRRLIKELRPYKLTKGEVLMIINLGVGLDQNPSPNGPEAAEDEDMAMENKVADTTETNGAVDGDAQNGEENAEDYGAQALLDTVVEEREERLSDEDVTAILRIVRDTLGTQNGQGSAMEKGRRKTLRSFTSF